MRNIQVIDGADNCAYDVFAATEEEFALIFPADRQDVAFIDEVIAVAPREQVNGVMKALWTRPVAKPDVQGIHGTLFYELDHKKGYYPNRRDNDLTMNRARRTP